MTALAREQALAQQAQVGRHLRALVQLLTMQQHAQTPERWQTLAECTQQEFDGLARLDLVRLDAECRSVLERHPAEELAALMSENRARLDQVAELQRQAVACASEQLQALGAELVGLQRGVRLQGAYGRARGGARFLNGTY